MNFNEKKGAEGFPPPSCFSSKMEPFQTENVCKKETYTKERSGGFRRRFPAEGHTLVLADVQPKVDWET